MTRACTVCLTPIAHNELYYTCNDVVSENSIGSMLTACVPAMRIDVVQALVLCTGCLQQLWLTHKFINQCMQMQKMYLNDIKTEDDGKPQQVDLDKVVAAEPVIMEERNDAPVNKGKRKADSSDVANENVPKRIAKSSEKNGNSNVFDSTGEQVYKDADSICTALKESANRHNYKIQENAQNAEVANELPVQHVVDGNVGPPPSKGIKTKLRKVETTIMGHQRRKKVKQGTHEALKILAAQPLIDHTNCWLYMLG